MGLFLLRGKLNRINRNKIKTILKCQSRRKRKKKSQNKNPSKTAHFVTGQVMRERIISRIIFISSPCTDKNVSRNRVPISDYIELRYYDYLCRKKNHLVGHHD